MKKRMMKNDCHLQGINFQNILLQVISLPLDFEQIYLKTKKKQIMLLMADVSQILIHILFIRLKPI